ncbi:DUF1076 domain-containing protein [Salmonella enterica]|nr:DUF1076 domain-containing protein [Salmonella enterica]
MLRITHSLLTMPGIVEMPFTILMCYWETLKSKSIMTKYFHVTRVCLTGNSLLLSTEYVYMPLINVNLPANMNVHPDHLRHLSNTVRMSPEGIEVSAGNRRYSVIHIPWLQGFSVNALDRGWLNRFVFRVDQRAERLEMQLNNGIRLVDILINLPRVSFAPTAHAEQQDMALRIISKIDSTDFNIEQENLLLPEDHLSCPITLSIPERGVFVRTSLQSDTCCLYDSTALKELVSRRLPHPVSREVMTEAHIVPKEQCHFESEKWTFVHTISN